jgi:hypothetical protein
VVIRRRHLAAVATVALLFPPLVGGCDSILGIQEKDFSPDADGQADDATSDGTSVDGAPPVDAFSDGQGSPADAPADVTYASCAADGSTGAVCGPTTYGPWAACSYAAICDEGGSRTRPAMTPTCTAGACSTLTTTDTDTTACARVTDGTACDTGKACKAGACVCVPVCAGKNCGGDGCGGSCGSCSGGNHVCNSGVCSCTPTAGCVGGGDVGNVCGADDGCGGPCTCDTANGESCGSSGKCCHNPTWFCTTNGDCCSGSCSIGPNTCN